MGKKINSPTKAERILRLEQVHNALMQGRSRVSICNEFSEKWGVSFHSIDRYINAVKKHYKIDLSNIQDDLLQHYRDLLQRAIRDRDYKLEKSILDSIAKMTVVTQRTDVTSAGQPITISIKLTDDEEEQ
jgi:hypothetical protein